MDSNDLRGLIMDAGEWASIVSPFYLAIGQVVEEFSRKTIAEIDINLLRLEREKLTEKLRDATNDLVNAADLEKKNKKSDLVSSGLGGSSLIESSTNGVDTRSADVLEKMHREFNRAIEKLALLEQKINVRNNRWWRRPRKWLMGE